MTRFLWILAGLCAALGVMIAAPGMRFSILLLFCGAAFFAVLAVLFRFAKTRRWAKICRNVLLIAFCAGLALFLAMERLVLSGARSDEVPEDISCIIVLGAGVNGTEPSWILRSRLNEALHLALQYPDIPIIVSGSQGAGEAISEAECMYRALVENRVPAERIWKEEQATSTRTNFAYSYALMRERGLDPSQPFAFVTSDFHMYRAKLLADAPSACGVAAELQGGWYGTALTLNYYVREAFALANEYLFRMDLDL